MRMGCEYRSSNKPQRILIWILNCKMRRIVCLLNGNRASEIHLPQKRCFAIFVSCNWWGFTRLRRNAHNAPIDIIASVCVPCIAWRVKLRQPVDSLSRGRLNYPTCNDPQSTLSSDIIIICVSIRNAPSIFLHTTTRAYTVCYLWFPFCIHSAWAVWHFAAFLHFNLSVSVIHLVSNTNLYDDNDSLHCVASVFVFVFALRVWRTSDNMRESANEHGVIRIEWI